eukprot:CAMPEP_0203890034 /NCGR_PEP_ID=MMETSP0359-20131031/33515_1 /ASSEMBLY_ACC=CAM_ASM_000338 /TAXON_ID=268821 /ORGANISM="Scrippsiella Hangoei, Strain SHTV-5" /LENGTH=43 /DNA_ID= /DNA_START= /DNA_END= /DNA_ORIENTATION=
MKASVQASLPRFKECCTLATHAGNLMPGSGRPLSGAESAVYDL